MTPQYSSPTRLRNYIAFLLPWAHGHQLKALGDFVAAIIEQQTACQAQLARYFGKQEAAVKRLSRLLHNERLDPRPLAEAVLLQTLHQVPKHGKVRLAIDCTIEADQHLLVVSLVVGRRAVPIYWRAYHVRGHFWKCVLTPGEKGYFLSLLSYAAVPWVHHNVEFPLCMLSIYE